MPGLDPETDTNGSMWARGAMGRVGGERTYYMEEKQVLIMHGTAVAR